jgi:hypothetical protein
MAHMGFKEGTNVAIRARNTDLPFLNTTTTGDPGVAGTSKTNYIVMKAPFAIEILSIAIVPHNDWVAAAPVNDGVVTFKRNNTGTAIASIAVQTALAMGTYTDAGALNDVTKYLETGDNITVDITANGTANAPENDVIVKYRARQGR